MKRWKSVRYRFKRSMFGVLIQGCPWHDKSPHPSLEARSVIDGFRKLVVTYKDEQGGGKQI